ncbi:MAG: peptidoglycan-associated lipoprotein Pal [Thermodesulfovibrionales bacterium]|nr:peptidoglycan-associated lipoprotein Pal [Thermodesulfovibrionales bacterium]
MKRLFVIFLIISGLIITAGCAQRKVAGPEQPSAQPETKADDKQKIPAADAKSSREMQKESITEKQLTMAQPADAKLTAKEVKTMIKDVLFDFDKYTIKEDAKPVIKEVAVMLTNNKKWKVIIEGHCDDRGTNEYNLGLGDKRAHSVKEHLISIGIPSSKIETISYGEEKPVCKEQTEECWTKNRRAHFVFIEESK